MDAAGADIRIQQVMMRRRKVDDAGADIMIQLACLPKSGMQCGKVVAPAPILLSTSLPGPTSPSHPPASSSLSIVTSLMLMHPSHNSPRLLTGGRQRMASLHAPTLALPLARLSAVG